MTKPGLLGALGRALAARGARRAVLAAALIATLAFAFAGLPVVKELVPARDDFDDRGSEAGRVEAAREGAGLGVPGGVGALLQTSGGVDTPSGRKRVESIVAAMRRDRGVAEVRSMLDPGSTALVSRDRRATYVTATLRSQSPEQTRESVRRLRRELADRPGVRIGGPEAAYDEAGTQSEHDLRRAELIAFPLLLIAALLVFRGGVAALIPLAIGALSILVTLTAMRIESQVVQLSNFALNLVTALSLGLAIDYSLFIVSRFREELAGGDDRRAALERTMATAGRTILISAVTVGAALASLMVFPERFLRSMGICGATVALSAAAAALTVLPALLAALGPRVDALSPRRWRRAASHEGEDRGPWYSLARWVLAHRALVAVGSAALMIGLAVPSTGARFEPFDAGMLPREADARQVDDALRADFPVHGSPVTVLAKADRSDAPRVAALAGRLRRLDGVQGVDPPRVIGPGRWYFGVQGVPDDNTEAARDLVRGIRREPAALPVLVGGETAAGMDNSASLERQLPTGLALLACTTFLLVFVLTRSFVLPVKTLIINVLTILATFGLLVLIFQHGLLAGPLGIEHEGQIDATQPVLLCALAFALTTDYGLFLLARIREAHEHGADSAHAAAVGLQRTGRIVTAAAVLFCIAVGAIATSPLDFIKLLGIGTALAVILDATIARALLVPSLVGLLGKWNWWAPRRLKGGRERRSRAGPPSRLSTERRRLSTERSA